MPVCRLYNSSNLFARGKERMKRIITLLLALVLLAAVPVCGSAPFADVRQTDWFSSYVETARGLGIVSGYPDGTFRPDNSVTYGEFLAMAMRGKALPDPGQSGQTAHWARKFYDAALSLEVFEETQIFARFLDEPIPRKDMALVMAGLLRAAGLGGRNVRQADKLYSDVKSSDEREYPIALCSYYGVLSGYPDGTFRPLGFLKRAEAAAAMVALDGVLQEGGAAQADSESEPVTQEPEAVEPTGPAPEAIDPAGQEPPEPETREELLSYEGTHSFRKVDYPETLSFMAEEALEYLHSVAYSARFVQEGGKYLVKVSWPDMPEGYGGKIDVDVSDANGTGIDGSCWICMKGMEKIQTYTPELKKAGGGEYVFEIGSLNGVGYADILVVLSREDGLKESSALLVIQDLATGKAEMQYKLEGANYRVSCTLPLEENVFLWK